MPPHNTTPPEKSQDPELDDVIQSIDWSPLGPLRFNPPAGRNPRFPDVEPPDPVNWPSQRATCAPSRNAVDISDLPYNGVMECHTPPPPPLEAGWFDASMPPLTKRDFHVETGPLPRQTRIVELRLDDPIMGCEVDPPFPSFWARFRVWLAIRLMNLAAWVHP